MIVVLPGLFSYIFFGGEGGGVEITLRFISLQFYNYLYFTVIFH